MLHNVVTKRNHSSLSSAAFRQTPSNIKHQPIQSHKSTLQTPLPTPPTKISRTTHVDKSHSPLSLISNALKHSAKLSFLPYGKQLHSNILKLGYAQEQFLQNQLLNLYVKCRAFDQACKLFDEMPKRNVVSWNTMISGSNRGFSGGNSMGFVRFKQMLVGRVEPDYVTFVSVLVSCIAMNDIVSGEQVHCCIVKFNFCSNNIVGSKLVDMYGKCGLVEDARRLFDRIMDKDLVLWNVMVSSYSLNGFGESALGMFELMRSGGFKGDEFTFSSLLSSCGVIGSCNLGMQIHGLIVRLSFDFDVLVSSSLVDMYVKTENLMEARKVFDGMSMPNVVSWTTLIVGYGRHGDGKEGMKLLKKMLWGGFYPDELTLASVLSSCSKLAAYTETIQVHAHATKKGLEAFLSMQNALINVYSKCGNIACAFRSFSLVMEPDLFTWTSIIGAYAFHGLPKEALQIFEDMLSKGVKPDGIVFVAVLSACSHGGLVDEGFQYFSSMTTDHHIVPDLEHYACLVDLLARAGHVEKAYDILASMPLAPTANILGAFVGACKAHGNIRLAKWAAEELFKLEPEDPVNYALMSNTYASVGRWVDVAKVRMMMRNQCDHKVPGCSWIELGGQVHSFVSSDKFHPQVTNMYSMLRLVVSIMDEGYMSNLDLQFYLLEKELHN